VGVAGTSVVSHTMVSVIYVYGIEYLLCDHDTVDAALRDSASSGIHRGGDLCR
jgi:hypothetical protein